MRDQLVKRGGVAFKQASIMLFVISLVILMYTSIPLPDVRSYIGFTQYYYPLLTKGFLSGHLSLPVSPPAGLLKLVNPYDPQLNYPFRSLFDATFYKGKYYLYFGPLPLLFFIPYYLIFGKLATSHAGLLFFLSVGFITTFYLLSRIRLKYFPSISNLQLILAGFTLGLCNNSLFLLGRPSVYEVAIASAYCFMSLAIFFLYKIFTNNFKLRDVSWFSICLALTVAGRPDFILACLTTIPIILYCYMRTASLKLLPAFSIALLGPMLLIAIALAMYNYVRFDSIFEFGLSFQIADRNRMIDPEMKANGYNWITAWKYYFISIFSSGPWAAVTPGDIKLYKYDLVVLKPPTYAFSFGYVKSILTTLPVTYFLLLFPVVYFKNKDLQFQALLRFMATILIAAMTLMLYITALSTSKQRYITDFIPYLLLLSILTSWWIIKHSKTYYYITASQLLLAATELASVILSFGV